MGITSSPLTDRRAARALAVSLVAGGALLTAGPAALADQGAAHGQASQGRGQAQAQRADGVHGQAQAQPAAPAQPAAQGQPQDDGGRPAQPEAPAPAAQPAAAAAPAHRDAVHGDAQASRPAPAPAQPPHRPVAVRPVAPRAVSRPAVPAATPAPSSVHADAGRITICHATGSATNAYVEITMSRNALPAHEGHQDGRDIVPAPAAGCPRPVVSAPAPAPAPHEGASAAGKVTICHATGSATNPYVEITISTSALPAHEGHQDGRDIVAAPAGGCPGAPGSDPTTADRVIATTTTTAGSSAGAVVTGPVAFPAGPLAAGVPSVRRGDASSSAVRRTPRTTRRHAVPAPAAAPGKVLGEVVSEAPAADATPAAQLSGAHDRLPFTGLSLPLLLLCGAGVLLAGLALRRGLVLRSER